MLNAVWVAVIVAVGFWVVLVCAAVFVLMRLSRLVSETGRAVSDLRDRSDVLIQRGHDAIEAAGEQIARTDSITASMDEVTANMAELSGRVAALAPLARVIAASAGSPLARVSAFVYGVNRAVGMRRGARGALLAARRGAGDLPARRGAGDLPARQEAAGQAPASRAPAGQAPAHRGEGRL